jgi:hypothetical protein
MNDLINIIINNGVAVGVVVYFIYKDYKWNNELLKTLTTIQVTLQEINDTYVHNKHIKGYSINKEV